MRWNLIGTPEQNAIVQEALDRCDFPFETFGEDRTIPVEWADLSRYAEGKVAYEQGAQTARHHGGEQVDPLKYREQVLGLAWYSGKVTLSLTMVQNPTLGMEVFLSEGAHMLDFFGMTDEHRRVIWNAVHPPEQHLAPGTDISDGVDLGHGHGWFDVNTYRNWVGEAWMGVFVRAFSDIPVSIPFGHIETPAVIAEIRTLFMPGADGPGDEPPEPFFGIYNSEVYHDKHAGIPHDVEFVSRVDAEQHRRPCRVCKP